MNLFRRRRATQVSDSPDDQPKKVKGAWKRPASMSFILPIVFPSSLSHLDTAFKQQRLKAWQPILTPKTVLPTLFIIGILFAPIGALLIVGSNKVCFNAVLILSWPTIVR
jgi:hypothetical protein